MSKFAGSVFDKETPHMIVVSRVLGAAIVAGCAIALGAVLFL